MFKKKIGFVSEFSTLLYYITRRDFEREFTFMLKVIFLEYKTPPYNHLYYRELNKCRNIHELLHANSG